MQVNVDEDIRAYRALAAQVRDAGLVNRRPSYYRWKIAVTVAAYAAGWATFVVVGNSWATLGVAAGLGVLFTQVAFLAHDAGHWQISSSRRTNRLVGLFVADALTGLSFGWWVPKHNAHHAHPNQIGRDPDIGPGILAFAFTPAVTGTSSLGGHRSPTRLLARWQAWLFFPLLLVEGAGLHITSVDALVRRRDRSAAVEGALLVVHAALFLSLVFWVLSPGRAFAFMAVQQGIFGLCLGCTFAPNHKGMPILDHDAEMSFVRRQVMTARNVRGGRFISFAMGGLNYQIEHHLFPTMPRPNLARAQTIVREFCARHDLPYREDSLVGSYHLAVRHLQAVAKAATPASPSLTDRWVGSSRPRVEIRSARWHRPPPAESLECAERNVVVCAAAVEARRCRVHPCPLAVLDLGHHHAPAPLLLARVGGADQAAGVEVRDALQR